MYLQLLSQLILYFNNILLIFGNFMWKRSSQFYGSVLRILLYVQPEDSF